MNFPRGNRYFVSRQTDGSMWLSLVDDTQELIAEFERLSQRSQSRIGTVAGGAGSIGHSRGVVLRIRRPGLYDMSESKAQLPRTDSGDAGPDRAQPGGLWGCWLTPPLDDLKDSGVSFAS